MMERGICNCLEAPLMEFLGLLVYATRTDSISSSGVRGRPAPVSVAHC